MPFFSNPNPFDASVEKATDERNTSEDWATILDICDKAKQSQVAAKNCYKAVMKRVLNRNPHIALQAISLLNACVKNAGRYFWLEIASKDFITDCRKIISEEKQGVIQKKISNQLKHHLRSWAKTEFKSDSELRNEMMYFFSSIPGLYKSLKHEGVSFTLDDGSTNSKLKKLSKDPNVVQSKEEEEDIAKAIALSLKDSEKSKPFSSSAYSSSSSSAAAAASSIYPAFQSASSSSSSSSYSTVNKNKEPRKVKALYDFEAVEDNELTFKAGEIIGVIDDSDQNWWKGVSWRGEGLFPANFVTNELESEDDKIGATSSKKSKNKNESDDGDNADDDDDEEEDDDDDGEVVERKNAGFVGKVAGGRRKRRKDEKINTTLNMLQSADPCGDVQTDPENMQTYEEHCKLMIPLINQELEKIDRQHMKLMEFNDKLIHSLELYHTLMAELPHSTTAAATSTTSSSTLMINHFSRSSSSSFNNNIFLQHTSIKHQHCQPTIHCHRTLMYVNMYQPVNISNITTVQTNMASLPPQQQPPQPPQPQPPQSQLSQQQLQNIQQQPQLQLQQ
ncbi:hypothetical protein HELRODRAFT_176946 [Helobdella robusta]|uniref:Signal transducing adapter molecule 1 n=1 Tax=Helobdella robusta TaxID=6412 RepID=T1FB23_HELRO|nr:hypothetical protein HELRODRAFT_176946 [Helobdella robusta]ESN98470.1 hypothetical protein HELRODRAFT_176946 [Helobdella robusta]